MVLGGTHPGTNHLWTRTDKFFKTYSLKDFQRDMIDKFATVPSALCGDDMGLGKTLEGIELDRVKRIRAGHFGLTAKTLVITTLTGTDVWTEHYRWAMPNMKVVTIDPKNRSAFVQAVKDGSHDVYICHWDALRLMPELAKRQWFHVIGDEVHKVKNRKAQVTRAFKKIRTTHKLGLSGTPGDNKIDDIWSILHWLYPNKFSSYWAFYKYYCDYVDLKTSDGNGYRKITGIRNEKHLQREMAPFFIRRRKEEVLAELPEKYYDHIWVDLSPAQRKAYNDMRRSQLAWVGQNLEKPVAAPIAISQLIRLQQFAVASVDVLWETKRVRNKDTGLIEDVPYPKYSLVDPSSKLDAALEFAKGMGDNSLVVFTQFKDAVALLKWRLKHAGISYVTVTGDVPKPLRDRAVQAFQGGHAQVFIGTIGSCRESITLTKASTELFIDRAWSPSWNRQAEDRCHRIGQENAVQIIDLMARNTVDLGRHQQIQQKWTWLQMMFGDKVLDYQKKVTDG